MSSEKNIHFNTEKWSEYYSTVQKLKVICMCHGAGKSTLAVKYPHHFFDFDIGASWVLGVCLRKVPADHPFRPGKIFGIVYKDGPGGPFPDELNIGEGVRKYKIPNNFTKNREDIIYWGLPIDEPIFWRGSIVQTLNHDNGRRGQFLIDNKWLLKDKNKDDGLRQFTNVIIDFKKAGIDTVNADDYMEYSEFDFWDEFIKANIHAFIKQEKIILWNHLERTMGGQYNHRNGVHADWVRFGSDGPLGRTDLWMDEFHPRPSLIDIIRPNETIHLNNIKNRNKDQRTNDVATWVRYGDDLFRTPKSAATGHYLPVPPLNLFEYNNYKELETKCLLHYIKHFGEKRHMSNCGLGLSHMAWPNWPFPPGLL